MEKSKPGWRGAYGPLVLAVILTALYKLGDGYVMGHLIGGDDKLMATLVYLTLGSVIGLLINYLLCQVGFLGKMIDPGYHQVQKISPRAQTLAAVSGIFAAAATGVYLWSFRTLDPSIVVPLTSLIVLYVAVAESTEKMIKFGRVVPSIVLVIAGVVIASFQETANWAVTGEVLLMVLLVHNIVGAISEIAAKHGVDAAGDAVSFTFWRFAWLAATAVSITIITLIGMDKLGDYLVLLFGSLSAVPFIGLVMVVVFFANGWGHRGLALSNATTKNLVMTGWGVVASVFATAVVAAVWPDVFPSAPTTVFMWFLRIIGAGLMMWAMIRLRQD